MQEAGRYSVHEVHTTPMQETYESKWLKQLFDQGIIATLSERDHHNLTSCRPKSFHYLKVQSSHRSSQMMVGWSPLTKEAAGFVEEKKIVTGS